MVKQFTFNLDAMIVIFLLFLASVFGNIFLAWHNGTIGKQLVDMQGELVLSQLNLRSRTQERDVCLKKLNSSEQHEAPLDNVTQGS